MTVKDSKRTQKSADKARLKKKDDIGNVARIATSGQIKFESLVLLMMAGELIAARSLVRTDANGI